MSNKEERKAPVLRFKGFTDDWEQRKLNTYLSVSKLKNKEERFSKQDVLSVSGDFGIVNQIKFQGRSFAGKSLSNYKIVKNGDIVYTKSPLKAAPYGIIKSNGGIPGIVSTLYAVYTPKKSVDSKFVELFFNDQLRLNRYLKPIVNIGAKHDMKVKNDEVINHFVTFPNKKEQLKISKLLQKMDDVISLQQQKNADIINLKKAILDKIFSNSNIQKWRDIRLNKVLSIPVDEPKEVTNIDDIISVKLNTQGISKIPNRSTLKLGSTKYYVRHGGQFIFGKQNFFNGSMAIIPSKYDGKVSSKDVPSLNINKDIVMPYFLWLYLSRPSFYKKTERWATGTGSKRLHIKDLLSLKIYIPNKNEQLRICKLMQSLDTQILKSQKHLKELQSIKKFLLQNMFI